MEPSQGLAAGRRPVEPATTLTALVLLLLIIGLTLLTLDRSRAARTGKLKVEPGFAGARLEVTGMTAPWVTVEHGPVGASFPASVRLDAERSSRVLLLGHLPPGREYECRIREVGSSSRVVFKPGDPRTLALDQVTWAFRTLDSVDLCVGLDLAGELTGQIVDLTVAQVERARATRGQSACLAVRSPYLWDQGCSASLTFTDVTGTRFHMGVLEIPPLAKVIGEIRDLLLAQPASRDRRDVHQAVLEAVSSGHVGGLEGNFPWASIPPESRPRWWQTGLALSGLVTSQRLARPASEAPALLRLREFFLHTATRQPGPSPGTPLLELEHPGGLFVVADQPDSLMTETLINSSPGRARQSENFRLAIPKGGSPWITFRARVVAMPAELHFELRLMDPRTRTVIEVPFQVEPDQACGRALASFLGETSEARIRDLTREIDVDVPRVLLPPGSYAAQVVLSRFPGSSGPVPFPSAALRALWIVQPG